MTTAAMGAGQEQLESFSWHTFSTAIAADGLAYAFGLYSVGAMLIPLAEHFDATRFEISLAFSLSTLSLGLASMAIGPLLDRHGAKRVMCAGACLFSGTFVALAYVENLWAFYLLFGGLLGLACAMTSQSASAKLVAERFAHQRGRVLALVSISVSVAGGVMPVLATELVASTSVGDVYLVYGLVVLVVLLPLTLTIRRLDAPPPAAGGVAPDPGRYFELAAEARFWKLVVIFGLSFSVIILVLVHTLPRIVDSGQGVRSAALVGSALALLGIPTKLLLSRVADSRGLLPTFCGGVGLQVAGLGLFVATSSYSLNLLGAAMFGLGMGIVQPSVAILAATLFGREQVGRVMGLMAPPMYLAQLIAVPLAGYLFDTQGSYRMALVICMVACIVVLAVALSMRGALREARALAA